jgi:glycosyltransferase involved in cell wall biosynthesis
MTPRVSICLPNLNNRPYLDERLTSILAQTTADWELVVSDNFSDDGAWEFLQAQARQEPRMQIVQAPREGMYANWNRCIERSRGEFVYVATSDDTLAPDCLEKMMAALDAHPECDLAHCPLRIINEKSDEVQGWWPTLSTFARSTGSLLQCPHVRRAPFDGLLHLLGDSVYISITQVLIRRSLFERIGRFETRWGSIGDFHWQMKAGLLANTIHVPDTWGGWRVHPHQATAAARLGAPEHVEKVEEMIEDALATCAKHLAPAVRGPLLADWTRQARDVRGFSRGLNRHPGIWPCRAFLVRRLLAGSWAARRYVAAKFSRRPPFPRSMPAVIRGWLENAGSGPVLVPVDGGNDHAPSSGGYAAASSSLVNSGSR